MAALHTEQLEYLGRHLALLPGLVDFLGVFPADCIPLQVLRSRSRDTCFIVNTDRRSLPGKHWLAFYYNYRDRSLDYFDSFGLPLSFYRYVSSNFGSRNIKLNTVNQRGMLQSITSAACGYYCILYLQLAGRYASSTAAINLIDNLGKNSNLRDAAVIRNVHSLMHKYACDNLPQAICFTRCTQSCCARASC
jgi:Adenovirus endoprotease